ncbi:HhH-GPD family base excision DNA repair protein [Plectosphaerella plurivora]|uniref:HhH-GPD family base excision DNA repair protein n=1 Tax=Plectosphaerella plurivora TaxID=936078 RepID=A0A9P8V1B0_9PEZI|nr:HhH-GPD family base excision DNA repair protein [Plectosphaerella plurivora]
MQTRAAQRAAAEALSAGQSAKEAPQLSNSIETNPLVKSEPTTVSVSKSLNGTKKKRAAAKEPDVKEPAPKRARQTKRARAAKPTLPTDMLPHGLGKIHTVQQYDDHEEHVPAEPTTIEKLEKKPDLTDDLLPIATIFVQDIVNQAIDGIITEISPDSTSEAFLLPPAEEPQSLPRRTRRARASRESVKAPAESLPTPEASFTEVADIAILENVKEETEPETKKKKREARRTKANPYGLMPGRTPFPDQVAPTADACREVHRILTETHGEFKAPDKIPAPSTSVAGCGEVPDLVDALIRTLISGHTTMSNANLAIQDVIAKYGQRDPESVGAGSIDWNKVRLSEEADIVDAVKRAGLGPTKGKDIKLILEQVYQDNQERKAAYSKEKATGETTEMSGARDLTQGQKDHQLLKIENGVLTLDHIRSMSPDEAMLEFTKYPGIGVKTASCLVLFCLQQPSFAVDTHVWRFCKWLGWVPPKASRDDTYRHGEVRIPDELKYGLHQLFIRHGKECGRCHSGTVEGTPEWDELVCPMEHLLDRFDKRKTKAQPKTKTKKAGKKAKAKVKDEEDQEEEEQSEETVAVTGSDSGDKQTEVAGGVDMASAREDASDDVSLDSAVLVVEMEEIIKVEEPKLEFQLRKRTRVDYSDMV